MGEWGAYVEKKPDILLQKDLIRRNFQESPETLAVLEMIDFTFLRDIFRKKARRAGIHPENIGFVEKEKIYEGAGSWYDPERSEVALSGRAPLSYETEATRVLCTLSHEESHASGHNQLHSSVGDILLQKIIHGTHLRVSGFHRIGMEGDVMSSSTYQEFRWFNEGMTDEIGHEVFREYLEAKVLVDPKTGKKVKGDGYPSAYPLARLFVRKLTERISQYYEVPYDVAWNSMVHAYMTGLSLEDEDIQRELDMVFGENFFRRLKNIRNRDVDIIDLTKVAWIFGELYYNPTKEHFKKIWQSFQASRVP